MTVFKYLVPEYVIKKDTLVYYSTNSALSNYIAREFYRDRHFVWCSPVFDPRALERYHPDSHIPPSSSPVDIYRELQRDVDRRDGHSGKIDTIKAGLEKGAAINVSKGKIDKEDYLRIQAIINKAERIQFKPLLYVIPYHAVENKIRKVSVEVAANPLGKEYQIDDLAAEEFHIIEFPGHER
jgi:hypothetical protein